MRKDDISVECIVRHSSSIMDLNHGMIKVEELLGGFSIVSLPLWEIENLILDPRVIQVDLSKPMVLSSLEENIDACISKVKEGESGLHGEGVVVAVIDSGIDIYRDDFQNEQGTRILYLYDQVREREYTKAELDEEIKNGREQFENSNHGTAVTSILAGSSANKYLRGVADRSSLLIVRLNQSIQTVDVMRAITYVVRKNQILLKPMVINLSLGSSLGPHNGNSILEQYINTVGNMGKIIFCIGVGNEANTGGHTSLNVNQGGKVEFTVGALERQLVIQMWRKIRNSIQMELVLSGGSRIEIETLTGIKRYSVGEIDMVVFVNPPTPTNFEEEILIYLGNGETNLPVGIYSFEVKVVGEGTENIEIYMMDGSLRSQNTRFVSPNPYDTMTIPSMAKTCISVAACINTQGIYAPFSGRGDEANCCMLPDIATRGVDLLAAGLEGYIRVSGTSFATPVVSGSCALLMEWGIVKGNDLFLYGEKLKAVICAGAKQSKRVEKWPNALLGYGLLCLSDSFSVEKVSQ